MNPKLPFSTIGVSKFNPNDLRHIKIKQKRDQYRADMQQGISRKELPKVYFTCSKCGKRLRIQSKPGHTSCAACGQWFQFTTKKERECELPVHLLKDPAQLAIPIPESPP